MDKQRTEQGQAVKSDYGWRTGQREESIAAGLPAGITFTCEVKLLIYLVMLIKLVKNIEISGRFNFRNFSTIYLAINM